MDRKALLIQCHEELIQGYMEKHPGVDWNEAYSATADHAVDRYADRLADYADKLRQRLKDEGK